MDYAGYFCFEIYYSMYLKSGFSKSIPTPGAWGLVIGGIFLFGIWTLSFSNPKKDKKPNLNELPVSGNPFIIANNKQSLAPIILPESYTPFMEEAANDLAYYIERISGARPQIIKGTPSPIPAKAIWVGFQPEVAKLFPAIKFNYDHPEEVINAANENYIIISGRDKWNPKNMTIPDRTGKKMITGYQQEYGTCNAVYTFIQDQLNVRWLLPGPLGEDYIEKNQLKVEPFTYKYYPTIRYRDGIFQLNRLISNKGTPEENKWVRHQRLQLSSMELKDNHAFPPWWAKYGKEHPEYFAMRPDGSRTRYSGGEAKICLSNPEVWEKWLLDVEEQIKANPLTTMFSAGTNDDWRRGHCACDKCRAWDPPGFTWESPALSDREMKFANTLGRLLKKKYPGKPYMVTLLAYGYIEPAPLFEKPDDNVMISSVSSFFQRGDGFEDHRTASLKTYADWGRLTKNHALHTNLGNPAGLTYGMPDIAPHQAVEDFRFIVRNNCLGIMIDHYWNYWSTQNIQYYSIAQLAWNPNLNIDSLLNDYYLRAYGPAQGEMKTYWTMMEDKRNELIRRIKSRMRFYRVQEIYTEKWFAQAAQLLQNAKARVAGADPKYLKRIEFAEYGFEYSQLLVDTRKKMERWENDKTNQAAINEIEANWAKAQILKSNAPKFAISNARSFNPNFPMVGMHPKYPIDDKTRRRIYSIQISE